MDQVITFDKSFQQRLEEYKEIFSGYDFVDAEATDREWEFYLELNMDRCGWQAVWKIPRPTCQTLNIPFPSVVIVLVIQTNLENLMAWVDVLAVQDDIDIPQRHKVPLLHLWPTREQDKTVVLNLQTTANGLDVYRFFKNYLLMPWDYEDDESMDWVVHHLESRLRLYYDMKNGVIPRDTADHLNCLIREAKRAHARKRELHDLIRWGNEEADVRLQAVTELYIRLMEIKAEVDILENPVLREAVIRRHKEMSPNQDSSKQNTWVIMTDSTASTAIQFLTLVNQSHPDTTLKFSPQLFATLDCANANDIFLLCEDKHKIKGSGALEDGGVLKGLSSAKEKTIITTIDDEIMLDFSADTLLENLTIDAVSPQCAIIVRRGQVTLSNCKLFGDGKSSTHQGIIVLNGAKLVITGCEISNFCTAIVGNSGAVITIENSQICDCNFGVKIYENCALTARKTTIKNCKNYGVCLETENNLDRAEAQVGGFDVLNIVPKLQMQSVLGNSNGRGDVVIHQKLKLKPLEDVFAVANVTMIVESDEETDFQNVTVIENAQVSSTTV